MSQNIIQVTSKDGYRLHLRVHARTAEQLEAAKRAEGRFAATLLGYELAAIYGDHLMSYPAHELALEVA